MNRTSASRRRAAAGAVGVIGGVLVVGDTPVTANTFDVTNTNATGPGSFGQAWDDANANGGPDTIRFGASVTGTINAGPTQFVTNDDVIIEGPGSGQVTIQTTNGTLYAYGGADLTVSGLTLRSSGQAALTIRNDGANLTATDVVISESYTNGIKATGTGSVTLTDVSVTNTGTGPGGSYDAVIIDVPGAVTMTRVTVEDSTADGIEIATAAAVQLTDVEVTDSVEEGLKITEASIITMTRGRTATNRIGLYTNNTNAAVSITGTVFYDDGVALDLRRNSSVMISDIDVDGSTRAPYLRVSYITDDVGLSASDFDAFGTVTLGDIGGNVVVSDTAFTNSTGTALSVGNTTGNVTVTDVDATYGDQFGVDLRSTGAVIVEDTTITGFLGTGLRATSYGATSRIERTLVTGGGADGFYSRREPNALEIIDSQFDDNDGDGIHLRGRSNVTLDGVTLRDNDQAGLLLDQYSGPGGTRSSENITMSNSLLVGNDGAIVAKDGAELSIDNSTLTDHRLDSSIILANDSTVNVASTTISGNTPTGGGITVLYAYGPTGSTITLENSIVSGNGGANNFVSGSSSLTAANSILAPGGSPAGGSGNIITDAPQLEALADNGGATETMRPIAPTSPAIDAGDSALNTAATDQRGFEREIGVIDIGAVERDGGTVDVQATAVVDEDAGSVDVAVTRSGAGDGSASIDVATMSGAAIAGVDFTAVSTALDWADLETGPKTVTIPVLADAIEEGDETLTVELSAPVGAVVGAPTGTITINDVFTPPTTTPPTTTPPTTMPPVEEPGPAITSLDPARFADTRPGKSTVDGTFAAEGKRQPGSEYRVKIAGRGDVPADARGVVMNVTAIGADGVGFVTAHPCVEERPDASSLNFTGGVNLGNEVIAGLTDDGDVCLFTSTGAHLTVDVVGYVADDSPTVPLTPARLLDTRPSGSTIDGVSQKSGLTTPGGTTTLQVGGRGGVPNDAAAVIINVTAIGATSTGFVTVHPCAPMPPNASSLNHVTGVNRGNELVASLDDDGQLCLFTSASINLTVDVVGYLPAGTDLNAVAPSRLLDTRDGQATVDSMGAGGGKRTAGSNTTLLIGGRAGVPTSAKAAIINVTAIGAESTGFVTVSPCVDPLPEASSLNYVQGVNGGNEIVARLNSRGEICLFSSAATHLTVDVVGYLA